MTLTLAAMEDLNDVCRLYQEVCAGMAQSGLDQWRWGVYPSPAIAREDIRRSHLYLYRERGEILCAVAVNREQDPEYGQITWCLGARPGLFHRLAISPRAQGRGLGRQVMAEVERILRAQGCDSLRGDTRADNHRALRLYEGIGMARRGVIRFGDDPTDFIPLEKAL